MKNKLIDLNNHLFEHLEKILNGSIIDNDIMELIETNKIIVARFRRQRYSRTNKNWWGMALTRLRKQSDKPWIRYGIIYEK